MLLRLSFESFKNAAGEKHPLHTLPKEDLDLIVQLVLCSGSLKELGEAYGVSYPTIRGRLDRVIGRLRAVLEQREVDPLREVLADLVERGELSVGGARLIAETAERREAGRKGAEP